MELEDRRRTGRLRNRVVVASIESISDPADGLQVCRVLRIGFNLFAQSAHEDVNRAQSDEVRVAPNSVKELIAGEHAARVRGQVFKQSILGRRGANWIPIYEMLMASPLIASSPTRMMFGFSGR